MGLDMYLNKKTYIGNQYKSEEEQAKVIVQGIKQARVSQIEEQVLYWRKENHFHKWFVDNVQDGMDDCEEYYVEKEILKNLISVCEDVLQDHQKAPKLLPTQEGFFFGSTSYDEYYFESVEQTLKSLKELLEEEGDGDFYYTCSW